MAFFRCDYRSDKLGGNTSFNVIIPEQCIRDIPTVYLLHGISGTQDDWTRFTAIERYAVERSIAVVMPSGDKSYYTDMKYGRKYYSYISEELVEYTRKIFPLSKKREKTFIAGTSMGGYGSLKAALTRPETFAACATVSGVPDIHLRLADGVSNRDVAKAIWGDDYLDVLKGSDSDIFELVKRLEASGGKKPGIYQVCGTEDAFYENNLLFRDFIKERGFRYEYDEGPGGHTWDFWDLWIPRVLDFFKEYMRDGGVEEYIDRDYTQPIVMKG